MNKLNRAVSCGVRRVPLPRNHEDAAKAQAYRLRDLIERYCGTHLSGGEVTDCYAQVYHGMAWTELMANLAAPAEGVYFPPCDDTSLGARIRTLRTLVPELKAKAEGIIMAMPRRQYAVCRTIDGAHIASLLSGRPTWVLPDFSAQAYGKGVSLVFDARTDQGYLPRCFSSDPVTGNELLVGVEPVTGDEVAIPVEQVRFIRLNRTEESGARDFALKEIIADSSILLDYYEHALSYPIASSWFGGGNSLRIAILDGGRQPLVWALTPHSAAGGLDLDHAIHKICSFYGREKVVILPAGLSNVKDPGDQTAATQWQCDSDRLRALALNCRENLRLAGEVLELESLAGSQDALEASRQAVSA